MIGVSTKNADAGNLFEAHPLDNKWASRSSLLGLEGDELFAHLDHEPGVASVLTLADDVPQLGRGEKVDAVVPTVVVAQSSNSMVCGLHSLE